MGGFFYLLRCFHNGWGSNFNPLIQSSKRTGQEELFFSMLVFERVAGVAVEAKRGGVSNLLIGEPGKSVMPLRTLEEIFIS
jgi:hypothetical protein